MKPNTLSHIMMNVKPLSYTQSLPVMSDWLTSDGSRVIGHKETHAKMTQKYELCNIYHAKQQSLDGATHPNPHPHPSHPAATTPHPPPHQPFGRNLMEWDHIPRPYQFKFSISQTIDDNIIPNLMFLWCISFQS